MNALVMILGVIGAFCISWAYWAFDEYHKDKE